MTENKYPIRIYANAEELKANLPDLETADPLTLAQSITQILAQHRAEQIMILDVRGKSDVTDYYVVATGRSGTQVQAMAGDVEALVAEKGLNPFHQEDLNSRTWAALDYGPVLVHIMKRESRQFYNIEKLYADADRLIPEETVPEGTASGT